MTREPRRDSKRIIAAREQTKAQRKAAVDRACYLAVKAALFPREGRA